MNIDNTKTSLRILTEEPHEGRKIMLLDLVWTTAYRPNNVRASSYANTISQYEQYRSELIDRILAEGWYVVLYTARRDYYRDVTLNAMMDKIGFVPDACSFSMSNDQPPVSKRHNLINGILPYFGDDLSRYLSLESNHQTRAMLKKEGIETMRREDYWGTGEPELDLGIHQIELFDDKYHLR